MNVLIKLNKGEIKMERNVGVFDQFLRAFFGILLFLYAWYYSTGTIELILYIIGAILIITAFFAYCPLYSIFGFSTAEKEIYIEKMPGQTTKSKKVSEESNYKEIEESKKTKKESSSSSKSKKSTKTSRKTTKAKKTRSKTKRKSSRSHSKSKK